MSLFQIEMLLPSTTSWERQFVTMLEIPPFLCSVCKLTFPPQDTYHGPVIQDLF